MRFSSSSLAHLVPLFLGMSSQSHATDNDPCAPAFPDTTMLMDRAIFSDHPAFGYSWDLRLCNDQSSTDDCGFFAFASNVGEVLIGSFTRFEDSTCTSITAVMENGSTVFCGEVQRRARVKFTKTSCQTETCVEDTFTVISIRGPSACHYDYLVEVNYYVAATATPSKAPSPGPTNLPTPVPSHSPKNNPTNSPTPAIDSWDLELTSVDSDFDKGSGSEITLNYKIGAGRKFEFIVLKKGCNDAIDTAVITPTNSTSPNEDDPSLENLSVFLDVEKNTIVGSNIWDSINEMVEVCVRVELLSSISGNFVKKLEHDFDIKLLFDTNFETVEEAKFGQITLGSNQTDAQVDDYIEACTCDSKESFECNQNVLGPDDFLNVCIKSVAEEMEINYLDSLKMVQEDNTLSIVWEKDLVDGSISSKSKVALENGVHVASVIPASFFSYESSSTAQVSGVVFLKLSGSSRRLAVEIDDSASTATRTRVLQSQSAAGDQESAFAVEVQLKRNELGVDTESNGAFYTIMTGFVGVTDVVILTAIMMW